MMISNLNTYLQIAIEAGRRSRRIASAQTRSKPGGDLGRIILYDPGQRSFKQALIAVVFAGIYLDALLRIEGFRRFGKSKWNRIGNDDRRYEAKLKVLGVTDERVLRACKEFRETRNDIVHERALQLAPQTNVKLRVAQREADNALAFIQRVARILEAGSRHAS